MQGGVKAIETGIRLLIALTEDARPQMLTTLASRAGMHPAKAHRYLVSFVRAGLIQRDLQTGRYHFGSLAIQMGVAALGNLNIVRVAADEVSRIRDELDLTVGLGVWGAQGPTHVFVEEANKLVVAKTRLGGTLSLLKSATGRVFGAYLPESITRPILEAELLSAAPSAPERAKLRKEYLKTLEEVRRHRMSRALGSFTPGIHALCCPILDHQREIVATLTILAPAGEFDPAYKGAAAAALHAAALRVSQLMGARDLASSQSG